MAPVAAQARHRAKNGHAAFKSTVTLDDNRRSRTETTVQLRKQKKDEELKKRRGMMASVSAAATATAMAAGGDNNAASQQSSSFLIGGTGSTIGGAAEFDAERWALAHPTDFKMALQLCTPLVQYTSDPSSVAIERLYGAVKDVRRYLSKDTNLTAQHIVDCGAIPALVDILGRFDHTELVFEAAWALTDVASTDKLASTLVHNLPTLAHLASLLLHPAAHLREQVIMCLGNLASESMKLRDAMLLTPGFVEGVVQNLTYVHDESMLTTVSWCTSNLFRGTPAAPLSVAQTFIPLLVSLLQKCKDFGVNAKGRYDAIWALLHATEGGDEYLKCGVDCGMVPVLMDVLRAFPEDRQVLFPALRALGNAVAASDSGLTEAVLNGGILDVAVALMEHPAKQLRQDMCWMLSNIASGTPQQAAQLFNAGPDRGVVRTLIHEASDAPWIVRKEAIWALCNLAATLSADDLRKLSTMGVVGVMANSLYLDGEAALVAVALEALDRIFTTCGRDSLVLFDELGGLDPLEELQNHRSNRVYKLAVDLITKFFNAELDDDDEYLEVDQNISPSIFDESFSMELPSKQLFPDGSPSSTVPSLTFAFPGSPYTPERMGATERV